MICDGIVEGVFGGCAIFQRTLGLVFLYGLVLFSRTAGVLTNTGARLAADLNRVQRYNIVVAV